MYMYFLMSLICIAYHVENKHIIIIIIIIINNSVNWLEDNSLCVAGDKSKILIVGTEQLKRKRLKTN